MKKIYFVFPNDDVASPLGDPVADDVPTEKTRNSPLDEGAKFDVQLGEIRRRVRVKEVKSAEFAVETEDGDARRSVEGDRSVDFRRRESFAEDAKHRRVGEKRQMRMFVAELQRGRMMNGDERNAVLSPRNQHLPVQRLKMLKIGRVLGELLQMHLDVRIPKKRREIRIRLPTTRRRKSRRNVAVRSTDGTKSSPFRTVRRNGTWAFSPSPGFSRRRTELSSKRPSRR